MSLLRRPRFAASWVLLLALTPGCDDGIPSSGSDPTITREAFIDAMVALRTSPVLLPEGYLPDGEPERILAEHGLQAEDIRQFVEVHGENVPMMGEIWSEIETRVREASEPTEPES